MSNEICTWKTWPPILTARTLCWCAGIQSLRQGPVFREVAIQVCIMMLLNGQKVDMGPFKSSNKIYWVTKSQTQVQVTNSQTCRWLGFQGNRQEMGKERRWSESWHCHLLNLIQKNYVTNVGVSKRYCISNKLTKSELDPHWHLAVQVAPTNSEFPSCHISSVIYEFHTLTNGCDQLYNLSKNLNEVILSEFLCMWEVLHQLCQARAQFKF
jgi:hypothetical protein